MAGKGDANITLSATDQTKAAFDSVKRNLGDIGDAAGGISGKFGTLGAAISAAFAGATLKGTIDVLDQLDDMSEKSGIATESLAALRYVGEVNSVTFETLGNGLTKLNRSMTDAAGGSKEAAAIYESMGVKVKDSNGALRTNEQVLLDVADKFKSYSNGAEKAALAQAIFGKTGESMIPLLNLGKQGISDMTEEAKKLGLVYSGDLAAASAKFNDDLERLKLMAEAGKVGILESLVPALNRLTQEVIEGKKHFGGYFAWMVEMGLKRSPFDSWADSAKQATEDIKNLKAEIERLQAGQKNVSENGGGAAFVGPSGTGRAASRLAAAQRELESAQRREAYFNKLGYDAAAEASKGLEDAGFKKTAAPVVNKPGEAKAPDHTAQNYIDGLQKQLAGLTGAASMVDEVINHLSTNFEKFDEDAQAAAITLAYHIDLENQMAKAADQAAAAQTTQITSQEKAVDAHYASIEALTKVRKEHEIEAENLGKTAQLIDAERFAREQAILAREAEIAINDRAMKEGWDELEILRQKKIATDELARALAAFNKVQQDAIDKTYNATRGVSDAIKEYTDNAKKVGDSARDVTGRVLGGIEDELVNMRTSGSFNARGLVDTIINEFYRLRVIRPLMADIFGGGSAGGGFLQKLFGGFSGVDTTTLPTGDFARMDRLNSYDVGTDYVPQDQIALIHKGERIIPANQNRPGAMGSTYAPVINVAGGMNRAEVYDTVRRALQENNQMWNDHLKQQGVLA